MSSHALYESASLPLSGSRWGKSSLGKVEKALLGTGNVGFFQDETMGTPWSVVSFKHLTVGPQGPSSRFAFPSYSLKLQF